MSEERDDLETTQDEAVSGDAASHELPVEDAECEGPALGWGELGLGETSLAAVRRMGFAAPSAVQQRTIPKVHQGVDLVVQAKTGSGKTLAFGLPILEKLDPSRREVQALVLTPTRELALQVSEEITRAGELGNRTVVPVFGGASMTRQISMLQDGAQVVVGTPGRILDHLNRRTLSLAKAWMVVLDEADEMLDKGFLPDVMRILDHTPKEKQTMLFSATVPDQITRMAERYCNSPERIIIGKAGLSVNHDIAHSYYRVSRLHKFVALVNILHATPHTKVLVFCNQKSDAEGVAKYLHKEGFGVGFLNGDLSQAVRQKVLTMFKENILEILVATDIAARGIDIFGVSHVVNYDVPENKERYLHRVGRTGRAGRKGQAISLVTPADLLAIGTIARNMNVRFAELEIPTKEDVEKRSKEIFMERLKAMELDGYPDDLALFADEMVETLEPHTIAAGLLTLLRKRGWDLDYGYDPENPAHKEQLFSRPPLIGLKEEERAARMDERRPARARGGSERPRREEGSSRGRRGQDGGRSPRRDSGRNPEPETAPETGPESAASPDMCWLQINIGRGESLNSPGELAALVCQTAGIRKKAVGEVRLGETESDIQVVGSLAERVIEGFAKRKRPPLAQVRRKDA